MSISVKFCGATRVVTGSCILVRAPGATFLVDCGLFQGQKTLKELNYRPFPFDPRKIDFVLLTHGHIDHFRFASPPLEIGLQGACPYDRWHA